jgi:chromosome partitioning protein
MTGTRGTAQSVADTPNMDSGRETRGVHLFDRRRPEQGRPGVGEHFGIRRLASRVGGEIFIDAELRRVDEDRGDDLIGFLAGCRDERHVPGMERSHGWDQRDPARLAEQLESGAKRPGRTDDLHRGFASDRGTWRFFACRRVQDQVFETADTMAGVKPHFLVFANEKGGTGKSTTAVHSAVALAAQGRRVCAVDLDTRQRTLGRYLDNRAATCARLDVGLPTPAYTTFDPARGEPLSELLGRMGENMEIVVVDTPGRDDPHAREAMILADTLVTPINDSFVDLDLIGEVDAETFRVKRPSFYAELVWNSRTQRAKSHGMTVDWVVLRNRMQHVEARNMRRVGDALTELSRRVGFRVIPGLHERVIYRELFPKGLTLLDLQQIGQMGAGQIGIGHIAARQELREMIAGLALPEPTAEAPPLQAASA